MTRQVLSSALLFGLLASLPVHGARADELPIRKAGLWEMKVVRAGSTGDMTMQQCTDETTDKEMSTAATPLANQVCSKRDTQKTATGFVTDSVCGFGTTQLTTHSEISGDFNSAYTIKSTSHSDRGGVQGDHVTTIDAKWLGACKPDQKPGDMMMPGGMKMNIHDVDKLKSLIPKSLQKPAN
jgi:hypothetical protein